MKSRKSNLPIFNKILKGINFRQISRHMSTSFFPNWKRTLVFIVWKRLFNNRGKNYFENTSHPEVFFKALDFDDKVEEMISNQRKCNEISDWHISCKSAVAMCFPQGKLDNLRGTTTFLLSETWETPYHTFSHPTELVGWYSFFLLWVIPILNKPITTSPSIWLYTNPSPGISLMAYLSSSIHS